MSSDDMLLDVEEDGFAEQHELGLTVLDGDDAGADFAHFDDALAAKFREPVRMEAGKRAFETRRDAMQYIQYTYGLLGNKTLLQDRKYRGSTSVRYMCDGCTEFSVSCNKSRPTNLFLISNSSKLSHGTYDEFGELGECRGEYRANGRKMGTPPAKRGVSGQLTEPAFKRRAKLKSDGSLVDGSAGEGADRDGGAKKGLRGLTLAGILAASVLDEDCQITGRDDRARIERVLEFVRRNCAAEFVALREAAAMREGESSEGVMGAAESLQQLAVKTLADMEAAAGVPVTSTTKVSSFAQALGRIRSHLAAHASAPSPSPEHILIDF